MNDALSGLAGTLYEQLQGAPVQRISAQLGADPQLIQSAIAAALPLMLGALGHNAQQPQGAQDLFGALLRDHAPAAGSDGLDLGGLLGAVMGGAGGPQANGAGILGHIFGNSAPAAAGGLGQATGLGGDKAARLMQMLAPVVMSFLAQRFLAGRETAGAEQLSQALGQEKANAQRSGGLADGLLGKMLGQDGQGNLGISDLMKFGGSLFGKR